VMRTMGLWDAGVFNKSELTFVLGRSTFIFGGLDDPQRLHGMETDIFWLNEAIEANSDDFDQLEQRCKGKFILDFNPAATVHWIFDRVETRLDVRKIHSTMRDNPFLPDNIVKKILSYEPNSENIENGTADEYYWTVYGLGERARREGLVYTNFDFCAEMPPVDNFRYFGYGLDFGYTNHPTTVVACGVIGNDLYIDELLYETGLVNVGTYGDSIDERLRGLSVSTNDRIWADKQEQKSIDELFRKGWNIDGADKGQGSVAIGIDVVRRYRLMITERSTNIKNEVENYCWDVERDGSLKQKPIKKNDHAMDAIRYWAIMELSFNNNTSPIIDSFTYVG